MAKKSNIGEFIEKAQRKHNYKYNYEQSIYITCDDKIEIMCPIHGSFWQTPYCHLKGQGCKKCFNVQNANKIRKPKKEFIAKCNVLYNSFYNYSLTNYISGKHKIDIICPIHGKFNQLAGNHLKGHGCPKCSFEKKSFNTEIFIERSNKIHNNFYDYSKVKYKDNNTKVLITCPIHGDFEQIPRSHFKGIGCKKCGNIKNRKKSNTEEFIKKSIKLHGNTYDYSLVEYKNSGKKVTIICKKHGKFFQEPRIHLSKCGCPKCNKYVGYSKNQWIKYNEGNEGRLYIIKCNEENEEFYKIGITGRSIKERYPYYSNLPYSWEIVEEIVSLDLEFIWNLEKKLKNILKEYNYKPLKKFPGSSVECFKSINKLKEVKWQN